MEKLKSIYLWLFGIIAALFGMFLYERSKKQEAQTQVVGAEDKVLEYKQSLEQENIDKIQKNMDELEKQHAESKEKELTPEEAVAFWKDKK